MRFSLLFILSAFISNGVWAINKCSDIDGKFVFQDAPCNKLGITVAEDIERKKIEQKKIGKDSNNIPSDIQRQLENTMKSSDEALDAARARCTNGVPEYPLIGMTEFEFKNCTVFGVLYDHNDSNVTKTANGVFKQLVYTKNKMAGIKYIYIRNGVVSAIQN